jgi:hypothetical protein
MVFVYYNNTEIVNRTCIKSLYKLISNERIYYINNMCIIDINNGTRVNNKDIIFKLKIVFDNSTDININLINCSVEDILLYYYLLLGMEVKFKLILDNILEYECLNKFDNIIIRDDIVNLPVEDIYYILNSSALKLKNKYTFNINIGSQVNDSYGYHRFGWKYINNVLADFSNPTGIYLDSFMEKTFLWDNKVVYNKPWYGIMHNPANIPNYLRKIYNIVDIFDVDNFKASQQYCKGLIVLSEYSKQNLEKRTDIPIYVIKHPIPYTIKQFSLESYSKNKKIYHIGYWLRNFDYFHKLDTKNNKKVILEKIAKEPWTNDNIAKQKNIQIVKTDENIEYINFIDDEAYDEMLVSSIVFIYLEDTSANNIIVECVQYNTPILINKHPAVVEYLGDDYPFYYDTIDDANLKVDDMELIKKTVEYLKLKNKDDISVEYFLKELDRVTNIDRIKFNIGNQLTYDFGQHRSGWKYAVSAISNRIKDSDFTRTIYLDTFLESTFCWGKNYETNIYKKPWSCIIHNPPNIPKWFQYEQSFESITKNKNFLKSIPYLKKIITLSDYNTKYYSKHPLIKKYNIPVHTLYHPTQIPDIKFDYDIFIENDNKKIIQIGWWLRKLHSIFRLPPVHGYSKVALGIKDKLAKQMLKLENKYEHRNKINLFKGDVELLDRVSDEEYDELLSKNIVFVEMYDSSANNLVIECIARNTPILINPVGGVVDYLGRDYPFYFNSLNEASRKLKNFKLIDQTSNYLKNNKEVNRKIDFDNFYNGLEKILC